MKKTKEQLLKEFKELENKENNSCYSRYSCNSCKRLTNGILCKGLRFKFDSKNAHNSQKYWVLNKEVYKKEFEEVKKILGEEK